MMEMIDIHPEHVTSRECRIMEVWASCTYLLANTSGKPAERVCQYFGFEPLTKYKSSSNHNYRNVTVWGLAVPNKAARDEFMDKQHCAKALQSLDKYRPDWREFYKEELSKYEQARSVSNW